MANSTNSKPRTAKAGRRKFAASDELVWLPRTKIKIKTWQKIEAMSGRYGLGYGLDCMHDLLLQREAEVIMLNSMLQANLPKVVPEAMAQAHALGQNSDDHSS